MNAVPGSMPGLCAWDAYLQSLAAALTSEHSLGSRLLKDCCRHVSQSFIRRTLMRRQAFMGVFALAFGIGLGGVNSDARSQIIDMGKYPNIAGGWGRSEVFGWAPRGEKPPLTPQYEAIYQANIADQATGGHGTDVMYRCLPPGMPREMLVYSPMEIVITPSTTYMLIDHIHDDRRIYTDGRDWPQQEEGDPSFSGYSIGRWIDERGTGKYDVLEVETRLLKGPRTLDGRLPTASDNQSIVRERIYLDKADPDVLHDEITLIDDAYTRPWTVVRNYPRYKNPGPTGWPEEVCAEAQNWISLGKEDYFLSSDGYLMPTKRGQAPPDLRYFKQTVE
jgi:hypothetical protein